MLFDRHYEFIFTYEKSSILRLNSFDKMMSECEIAIQGVELVSYQGCDGWASVRKLIDGLENGINCFII